MVLPLGELQNRIGYRFQSEDYLRQAVTHSSYANETGMPNHHLLCNERLEFLGDSILSLVTVDYLYQSYPQLPEGDLTRMRATLVCEDALAAYARKIELGSFLLLGKGERNGGGADKPAVIADAFEAMLAAIYLDAGGIKGIEAVTTFLLPYLKDAVQTIVTQQHGNVVDSKSRLQEFIQKDQGELEYKIIGESGPDHDKTFTAAVYLDSNCIGEGSGRSKKQAEQDAARNALKLFGIEH